MLTEAIRIHNQSIRNIIYGPNSGKDFSPKTVFFIATSSENRLKYVQHLLPEAIVVSVPIANELTVNSTLSVALDKMKFGALTSTWLLQTHGGIYNPGGVIAADVLVYYPDQKNNGDYIAKKKPTTWQELQANLQTLSQQSVTEPPHYLSQSASVVFDFETQQKTFREETTIITLDEKWLKYLASDAGTEFFLYEFPKFYSCFDTNLYALEQVEYTSVAGGIPLELITGLGAVSHIDGIPRDSADFPRALKRALTISRVGIAQELLIPYRDPMNGPIAEDWSVVNNMVDRALTYKPSRGTF